MASLIFFIILLDIMSKQGVFTLVAGLRIPSFFHFTFSMFYDVYVFIS